MDLARGKGTRTSRYCSMQTLDRKRTANEREDNMRSRVVVFNFVAAVRFELGGILADPKGAKSSVWFKKSKNRKNAFPVKPSILQQSLI